MSSTAELPDRYGDAVRARRAELRAARALLLGGHRAELRHGLAVARLAASAELAAVLAGLDRELRDRARPPTPLALDGVARAVAARVAAVVLPAVRRVAAVRGLTPPVAWPGSRPPTDPLTVLLSAPLPVVLPAPDPPPSGLRVLVSGAGTWRLALLPAAALPALSAGRALLPAAVGLGVALLVVGVRVRRTAAERARRRRFAAEVVAALRQAWETELARRLLEVEHRAGAALDDAVARRRAAVDAELRALAPAEVARAAG